MIATSMTALDLLDALVRIDSVNPGLDPDGAGEVQIAAYVARWGRSAGLRVDVLEGTTGRPSVIVRGGRGRGGRRLLLCGHLDTVGLAGNPDGLTPRIQGDRLYGRGAYDMKAGLAAALIACRDAALAGIDGEVIVAAVADEELASLGIAEALTHLDPAGIDAAVVTEPTERQAGTAHRGFAWTEITVTGVAAHGSRPHQRGPHVLLGRLGLPRPGRHPHRALRTRRRRRPRRHRVGQPLRHHHRRHCPHPARPGLLLLNRPNPHA